MRSLRRVLCLACCAVLFGACGEASRWLGGGTTGAETDMRAKTGAGEETGEFHDTLGLLESIREGTFSERAGLSDELEALRVPGTVRVDFVRGSRVPEDQEGKLERLARELEADDRLQIDVIGCSDPPGSESLNLRISRSRAASVAARLRELGVPESQVGEVAGRGESCQVQQRMVRIEPSLVGSEKHTGDG